MSLWDVIRDGIHPTRAQVIWMAVCWAIAIGLWAVAGVDRPWKSRRQ